MNQTNAREQRLFEAALHLESGAERQAFLQAACAADPDLRARVEQLLAAASEANAFFQKDPLQQAGMAEHSARQATTAATITEERGENIGRYKLLQKIGEGGCGVVYMAEQEEPVRRRVALKVIKLGMDTKSFIARV